jgi:hypothetical protein
MIIPALHLFAVEYFKPGFGVGNFHVIQHCELYHERGRLLQIFSFR